MKKAIVTGAGGFIGSHCVDMLLEKGWKVWGTMKPNKKTRNLDHLSNTENYKTIELDIRDTEKVKKLVHEVIPDGIFHFAAQSLVKPSWEDPNTTIETNMKGTINLFESLKSLEKKPNTRVIIACSSAAYGTSTEEELPLKETNPIRALHPYGISKIGQELLGRQYFINFGIECVNLRLFNQTGPRKVFDASSDFALKTAKIECGRIEPVIEVGNLETFRDITGIKDTLQGIWLAYTRGIPGETYNLCSNKPTKIRDVLDYLVSLSSKKIKVIENAPEHMRITDEPIILGDNSKIIAIGYKPTQSIENVLKEMFDDWVIYFTEHEDYVHTQ